MANKWSRLTGSGNWDVAGNWTPSGVPGAGPLTGIDVTLDHSFALGSYSVSILAGETYSIHNLVIDSTSSGNYSISLDLTGSHLSVTGALSALGANDFVTLQSSAILAVSGMISGSGLGIVFLDSTSDVLSFANARNFTGAISNFGGSNSIDLTGLNYSGGFGVATSGRSLFITQPAANAPAFTFSNFSFLGASASNLRLSNDGHGGTLLTVCFASGTRIAGNHGEVAVEDLQQGDLVVTMEGKTPVLKEVRWVGRRRLDIRNHPHAWAVAPVRIQAGAFADGVPHRDLVVSPDHAILTDSGLIPARQLVNHMTIRQETERESVEYFHVELDRHSILVAEGLPTESYLDTGNRGFFGNSQEPFILHPDLIGDERIRSEAGPCVPFVTEEALVRPVWQQLHDRAVASGMRNEPAATTREAELRVIANGCELKPVTAAEGHYVFALPAGTRSVQLVSRSAAATAASPWLDDRRLLGVAIERIALRSADGLEEISMDHPALSRGWWGAERAGTKLQRWTDGNATIPLTGAPVLLELAMAGTATYVLDPSVRQAA